MASHGKLLVVDVAALGWDLVSRQPPGAEGLTFQKAESVFPAVTCTAQASFRTAAPPRVHGMIGNGLYFRDLCKVLFWEQSATLVEGPRIWKQFRERGRKVGMLFWQQSLGEEVDFVLSPKPVHKHSGGMIQDCYSQPHDLYARLAQRIGKNFNLMHYWGPLASHKSSEWIVAATCETMSAPDLGPDLLFTYLPHLDYDLQRRGPGSKAANKALQQLHVFLEKLRHTAEANGYDFLIFGDYAMGPVDEPAAFPNRALRDAGLFKTRIVKGMAYPDFFTSEAFAMVDHEIAHVFVKDEAAKRRAREALSGLGEIRDRGDEHARSGDLILVAEKGSWFAYPWWSDKREAPDFASHVDIHNKPGYDPCELFFGLPRVSRGWPPLSVSSDTTKIKGTHGRVGAGSEIAWASSLPFDKQPGTLLDLAAAVRDWCEQGR